MKKWLKSRSAAAIGLLLVIAAVLFLLSSGANAHGRKPQPEPGRAADLWVAPDKAQHFGVSAGLGVAATALVTEKRKWDWATAQGCGVECQRFSACLVPGVWKEIHDARKGSPSFWSEKDLVADALGCGVGVYLGGMVFSRQDGRLRLSWQRAF